MIDHRSRTAYLLLASFLLSPVVRAAEQTEGAPTVSKDGGRFFQKFSRGKDVIRVEVRRKQFQRSKHKLKIDATGGVSEVDGRPPRGTDASAPEAFQFEIADVRVSWNGAPATIDRRLYVDCFNPSLSATRVLVAEDFKSVIVTTSGGDGAGAYEVMLFVPREGAATRFLAGEGGF